MGEVTIIGVDLAKNVFHLHGATADGSVVYRKKLSRPQFARFMWNRQLASWRWRLVSLPRRISDEVADVRLDGREAGLGRIPGAHLTGGADRVLFIKDRSEALSILLAHMTHDVLDDEIDVQANN